MNLRTLVALLAVGTVAVAAAPGAPAGVAAADAAAPAVADVVSAQAAPNDPHFPQQWGLRRLNAASAWRFSQGEGVVVAVVDSGVSIDHPDLSGGFARDAGGALLGRDLVDDGDDPTDEHGHGTMVAGIVAARTGNGIGVASVAPLAQVMPVRVLDDEAAGRSQDVDAGIRWAVTNGADVINLSLEVARDAGSGSEDVERHAPDEAVRYAWEQGVVVVAAAGNHASDFTDYAADAPVLLVGAVDRDDQRAAFSDRGRRDGVMAPGVEVVSTWCNPCGVDAEHTIGVSDGTSYAAAHVSGVIALLLAQGVGPQEAVEVVRATAADLGPEGPDDEYGHGLVDAEAALRAVIADDDTGDEPGDAPGGGPDSHAAEDGPVGSPAPTAPPAPTGVDSPRPPSPAPSPGVAVSPGPETADLRPWATLAAALIALNLSGLAWWRRSGARGRVGRYG